MGAFQNINWDAVSEIASRLGASDEAIRKWKVRGAVPGRWHVPIIAASKGKIPASAFLPTPKPEAGRDAA